MASAALASATSSVFAGLSIRGTEVLRLQSSGVSSSSDSLDVRCLRVDMAHHPQKKGTAHHRKTRPKKLQPYDRNRKPAVYEPLPPAPPLYAIDVEGMEEREKERELAMVGQSAAQ
eukprot:TRINITY_DN635_c0_g1_i12.p1 TRINITY_DN635_c0_g1~~TRINITY_DN635_c0_g1_i12.p1  ORF type:complete len:116 (-),score=23.32 TRINITY_DN635_c0_g1_i12:190-537(-)